MPKTTTKPDRLKQAHDKLQAAVESIVTSEDWKRMLKVASTFHRYSFNNHLMIFLQRPDATIVAGFRKWQKMNRSVRKGEKGIAIFAPCKYRVPPENDPSSAPERSSRSSAASRSGKIKGRQGSGSGVAVKVAARSEARDRPKTELRGFRVVHVFDISQTDGEELADLDAVRPKFLSGEAPEGVWDALVAQANEAGFEVIREQKRTENGYCDFLRKVIAVRPDVDPAQAVKTLVHEVAHALLHSDGVVRPREIQEVEVESVAFIVCDALGHATHVLDRFHVVRWLASGLIEVRRRVQRGEPGQSPVFSPVIFRTRYLQLARAEHLDGDQFGRLALGLTEDPELLHAWRLLQQLYGIYDARDEAEAKDRIEAFVRSWDETQIPEFRSVLKALTQWLPEILAFHQCDGISNGRLEGINNKVGVLKRIAYGFVNVDNFGSRALLWCPGVAS